MQTYEKPNTVIGSGSEKHVRSYRFYVSSECLPTQSFLSPLFVEVAFCILSAIAYCGEGIRKDDNQANYRYPYPHKESRTKSRAEEAIEQSKGTQGVCFSLQSGGVFGVR